MLDSAIHDFLEDRKKEKKSKHTLDEFLPDAAKRAKQLSFSTHVLKFSHPNAKGYIPVVMGDSALGEDGKTVTSPTLTPNFIIKKNVDGLIRTGNVVFTETDVIGNAASIDVYKFLLLTLQDGQTVLAHLEQETDYIRKQFSISTSSYEELATGLLAIKQGDEQPKTHGSIKQVYFPVGEDNYHLLSVLTPSGILYELKQRINAMRFSEQAKVSREARRENKAGQNYSEVFNLTLIGFGGTKPQNISVLNNQNGGVAYLLNAAPPVLKGRQINPPRTDFFDFNYTKPEILHDLFETFHQTLMLAINNKGIRDRIQGLAKAIFFELIDRSWQVRYLEPGWSDSDRYQSLPKSQKLWLDQQYREAEQKDETWLDNIEESVVRWFINAYEKMIGKQALTLSDYEFIELKKWLQSCGEGLK